MRVIDLLNKIANGEEVPKKIKFYGKYYIWYDNRYTGNEGYCLEPVRSDSNSFLEINTVYDLNNEVEVIDEDKKIKNIYHCYMSTENKETKFLIKNINDLVDKINEIIEKIETLD